MPPPSLAELIELRAAVAYVKVALEAARERCQDHGMPPSTYIAAVGQVSSTLLGIFEETRCPTEQAAVENIAIWLENVAFGARREFTYQRTGTYPPPPPLIPGPPEPQ